MKDRIAAIMEYKGLSSSAFADIIEIPRSRVSHIMSGRNKATLEVVTHIMKKFPDINILWLMTGNGIMLNDSDTTFDFSESQTHDEDKALYGNPKPTQEQIPSSTHTQSPNPQTSFNPFKHGAKDKQIERIIVFYTDDSFKEYR